jgi:protein SCO1/2
MRSPMPFTPVRSMLSSLVLVSLAVVSAWAQPSRPVSAPPPGSPATAQIPILKSVGIDQKLDNPVPRHLPFTDSEGREVTIGQYFGPRPVMLVLAYYECPVLCTQVINAAVSSILPLTFEAGKEFEVVVVSFDPGETPAMAKAKRTDFLHRYGRSHASGGVHFLTGRESSIAALTDAVGFRYAYDDRLDEYAHPAVMTILTPQGRVSRYLFGIEFAPRDLRFALVEAAENRIGTIVDRAMLFCYNYDPQTGRYGFAIMTAVRVAGLVTLVVLGTFIVMTLRRDRRQDRAARRAATGTR